MAYMVSQKQKVPDSNIIYMSYNNIATNKRNPIQGDVFNWPTAPNCYNADQFDYQGDNVTAAKFLGVLKGDTNAAGGPVLKSNSDSTVFIFYSGAADSGAGTSQMPNGPDLTAAELIDAINYMDDHHMYKEMVIYWASDYAGAMFENLSTSKKVFVVASSGPDETQEKAYCPPNATVDGYDIGACLASEFGTTWLQDSYNNDPTKISISAQAMTLKE